MTIPKPHLNPGYMFATLRGGTNDGRVIIVMHHQPSVYAKKRMSISEMEQLCVNGEMAWRSPDELYERVDSGEYRYKHTVHYKPTESGDQIIVDPA